RLSAHCRRLRRGGAARLQGGRWRGSLSEGTTRSLPARRLDNEPACGRGAANLRDGRPAAARSQTAALALLNSQLSITIRNIAMDMRPPSVATMADDAEIDHAIAT